MITAFQVDGASETIPKDIDNSGRIVGRFGDTGDQHGFIRNPDGSVITIDVPGADQTALQGINNLGVVTGYYTDTEWHGFLRSPDGTITVIRRSWIWRYRADRSYR